MKTRVLGPVALLLGGGLGMIASAQPWWRAEGDQVSAVFTGTSTTAGLSQALAVLLLAGVLLSMVLRAGGRRVLSVLLAFTALGMAATGILRTRPSAEAVRAGVREVSLADQFALVATNWAGAYAAAGAIALTGAVLTLVAAPQARRAQSRFERAPVASTSSDPADAAATWRVLDAGLDPTADPDVRMFPPRGTMEHRTTHRE